jgi:beta-galactosidase
MKLITIILLSLLQIAIASASPARYERSINSICEITPERVFDVAINGTTVLEGFDISNTYGNNVAVIKKFPIDVYDGSGITVSFEAVKGLPVLNAVRILKVQ